MTKNEINVYWYIKEHDKITQEEIEQHFKNKNSALIRKILNKLVRKCIIFKMREDVWRYSAW